MANNRCHNAKQVLIALDQLVFCVGGSILSIFNPKVAVWADMTISAQAYRLSTRGYWYGKVLHKVIDTVFFFEKEHCKASYEAELNHNHLPDDL